MTDIAAAVETVTAVAAATDSVMARATRIAIPTGMPRAAIATVTHRVNRDVMARATPRAMRRGMARVSRDAILLVDVRKAVLPHRPPTVRQGRRRRLESTIRRATNPQIAAAKQRRGRPARSVANANGVSVADVVGGAGVGADDATARQSLAMARPARRRQVVVVARPDSPPRAASRRMAALASPVPDQNPAVDSALLPVQRRHSRHRNLSGQHRQRAVHRIRHRKENTSSGPRRRNPAPAPDLAPNKKGDAPRLTPHAVGGAVLLSASALEVPAYGGRLLAMLQAAAAAAGGMALAGASARLQSPVMGVPAGPAVPAVPNVAIPQLPGAAGRVQAGIGSLPSAGGMSGMAGQLPGVAGAMASPAGAVAQGAASGGVAGAVAAALGSVPVLQGAAASAGSMAVKVPGGAAIGNIALPNPQMPALPNPNLSLAGGAQLQMPIPPPPDPAVVFRGQQPFIEIGIGIASGRIPVA